MAAVVLLLAALFFYFDLGRHLTLASLKENRLALVSFYERHQFAMVVVFIAVYILQTALSLPGAPSSLWRQGLCSVF